MKAIVNELYSLTRKQETVIILDKEETVDGTDYLVRYPDGRKEWLLESALDLLEIEEK